MDPGPLSSAGLEIVGVCRGAAAPVSLQRLRPHVVVASSALRGISTSELARMLAQTEDGIPLVLVGAKASTLNRRQAASVAGAFDYFQLPGEIDLLVLRVEQLIAIVRRMGVTVRYIMLTHSHLDHISGCNEAKAEWAVPLVLHKEQG